MTIKIEKKIVGYQVAGSLGSRLVRGDRRVRIYGREIAVRAKIHTLGGFSAHAGQSGLLDWLGNMVPSNPRTVIMHGAPDPRHALGEAIGRKYGLEPEYPGQFRPLL